MKFSKFSKTVCAGLFTLSVAALPVVLSACNANEGDNTTPGTTSSPAGTTSSPAGTTSSPAGTNASPSGTNASPGGTKSSPGSTTSSPGKTTGTGTTGGSASPSPTTSPK